MTQPRGAVKMDALPVRPAVKDRTQHRPYFIPGDGFFRFEIQFADDSTHRRSDQPRRA